MDEWGKGYWTGVTVISLSLLFAFRPDLLANPIRKLSRWLDRQPVYRMTVIHGGYEDNVSSA